MAEITSTLCPKLVFWTRFPICWPYVNLGPKGMDLLGFFNYLFVSESCCIVATWLPSPDCSGEYTVDEKQKSREDPQALAVVSLKIAPYWARGGNVEGCWDRGLIFHWDYHCPVAIAEEHESFPRWSFPHDLCKQKDGGGRWRKEWDNELWSNKRLRGWERERAHEIVSPTTLPWNSQMFLFL